MNKYKHLSKVKDKHFRRFIHNKDALSCSKKIAFETEDDATKFIASRGFKLKLRVYKCSSCNMFHTASINKEK